LLFTDASVPAELCQAQGFALVGEATFGNRKPPLCAPKLKIVVREFGNDADLQVP
jgi:hypothetical protein